MLCRIFILLYCFLSTAHAQNKVCIRTLGTHRGGFDGATEDNIIRYDSTFEVTSYKEDGGFFSIYYCSGHKNGIYKQKGDTLFLNDMSSRFYPVIKEENIFLAWAKDSQLMLFPATIISRRTTFTYTSYLNLEIEIGPISNPGIPKIVDHYISGKDALPKKMTFFPITGK